MAVSVPQHPTVPTQRTASPEPSSLTQAGPRPSGTCRACGSTRVTALAMTLTDGTRASLASCHDCEHRSWTRDGVAVEFGDILARAAKR